VNRANSIENVHKNYLSMLSEPAQSGNAGNGLRGSAARMRIPMALRQGPFAAIW